MSKNKSNIISLPTVQTPKALPSFELRTNKDGYIVIIIRENGNESAAVLDNEQAKQVASNILKITKANGLNNKKR